MAAAGLVLAGLRLVYPDAAASAAAPSRHLKAAVDPTRPVPSSAVLPMVLYVITWYSASAVWRVLCSDVGIFWTYMQLLKF